MEVDILLHNPYFYLWQEFSDYLSGYSVDDIPDLVEQYMRGDFDLDPFISNQYPLEKINEAIEELKAGDV